MLSDDIPTKSILSLFEALKGLKQNLVKIDTSFKGSPYAKGECRFFFMEFDHVGY